MNTKRTRARNIVCFFSEGYTERDRLVPLTNTTCFELGKTSICNCTLILKHINSFFSFRCHCPWTMAPLNTFYYNIFQ